MCCLCRTPAHYNGGFMPSRKPLQPRKFEEPAKKPRRLFPSLTPGKVVLAIAVGVIITIIGCFIPRTNLSELSALKDKAIGLAENGDFAEADEVLRELQKKIPSDPLVARNLAVVRLSRAAKDQDPRNDDP